MTEFKDNAGFDFETSKEWFGGGGEILPENQDIIKLEEINPNAKGLVKSENSVLDAIEYASGANP